MFLLGEPDSTPEESIIPYGIWNGLDTWLQRQENVPEVDDFNQDVGAVFAFFFGGVATRRRVKIPVAPACEYDQSGKKNPPINLTFYVIGETEDDYSNMPAILGMQAQRQLSDAGVLMSRHKFQKKSVDRRRYIHIQDIDEKGLLDRQLASTFKVCEERVDEMRRALETGSYRPPPSDAALQPRRGAGEENKYDWQQGQANIAPSAIAFSHNGSRFTSGGILQSRSTFSVWVWNPSKPIR